MNMYGIGLLFIAAVVVSSSIDSMKADIRRLEQKTAYMIIEAYKAGREDIILEKLN